MRFSKLSSYLQKLESLASRNAMTEVLAELFKKATPEDARLIAYLSQGRLGPAYNSPDFGVADKMMLRALGEQAEKLFKQKGDLGLVAQALNTGRGNLSIKQVHENLFQIATLAGTGSQEKKQQMIRELLANLDPVSAKYAVKIILGKLRTGFSDMTILDSLSWMKTGDKSLRKNIEAIYNVRADLGEVAELTKNYNSSAYSVDPKIGTPVLMAKCERASTAEEIWERNGRCSVEYKLDGLRIQAHIGKEVTLFSRGLENVTAMYPDVVEGLKTQIKEKCIVEGEMIAVDKHGKFLPFQETVQRKRKYQIEEMKNKVPLTIYLFDVLKAEGESLLHKPNQERREILEHLHSKVENARGEVVKLMPRKTVTSISEIDQFYRQAIAAGTEGIIAKKDDGPYQAGSRDFNWIKYKKSYDQAALSDTIDAVVMGYDMGQGKRSSFGIGDFLIGVYRPEDDAYLTIAKIGTGLTDEEWKKMKTQVDEIRVKDRPKNYDVKKDMFVDVWCQPKIVVEIQADEITKSPMHSSGLALRFPRLISWREKKPEDATSIAELQNMVKLH